MPRARIEAAIAAQLSVAALALAVGCGPTKPLPDVVKPPPDRPKVSAAGPADLVGEWSVTLGGVDQGVLTLGADGKFQLRQTNPAEPGVSILLYGDYRARGKTIERTVTSFKVSGASPARAKELSSIARTLVGLRLVATLRWISSDEFRLEGQPGGASVFRRRGT